MPDSGTLEQLQERVRIMDSILSLHPDFMYLFGTDRRFVFINQSLLALWGLEHKDAVGKDFWDLKYPDALARKLDDEIKQALEGHTVRSETEYTNHENKVGYYEYIFAPVRDPQGKITGVSGTTRDITERKKTENELNRLRQQNEEALARLSTERQRLVSLFEQAPLAMGLVEGPAHRFTFTNPHYSRLLFGGKEVVGRTVAEAVPEGIGQGFVSLLDEVYSTGIPYVGKEVPIELRQKNGDFKKFLLDFVYQPLKNASGSVDGILAVVNDVTEAVGARQMIESAATAIANERENFRNLFQQTPEMVCILDGPGHRFEFVNEAHVKVLGFDATGKTVREAQPESTEVHGILDRVYETGVTAELFEIPVTVGNRRRHFNLTYSARRNTSGQINGVMILGTEITDQIRNRERLERTEEQLGQAIEVAKLGFYDWDITENKITFSSQMIKDWGVPSNFVTLADVAAYIHEEDRPRVQQLIQNAMEKNVPYHTEYRVRQPGGGYEWMDVRGHVHRDTRGNPIRFFGTSVVKTDQKNTENELRQARADAEKASAAKGIFLANMSHEIRTPLGAIMGFLDLLKNPANTREDLSDYIGIIDRNSKQLLRIVDDVLDLSKIEAGKFVIESIQFSLIELLADFNSLMSFKAKEKGLSYDLQLETTLPDKIEGDPTRIRQILGNAVGNAIKFTEKGHIHLRASFKQGVLQISVEDTGCGIDPEKAPQLFQPFSQADGSTTRIYGGTGLGLSLTRHLSEALGGSFRLQESALGKGSLFVVTLPLKILPDTKMVSAAELSGGFKVSGPKPAETKHLQGMNILVVDDSPDNQALIKIVLQKWGARTEAAANGREGLTRALASKPDVVLMDVQMPVMDGHEATRELRAQGFQRPIIALTAHAMKEERMRCEESGFSGFLSKPISKDAMLNLLVGINSPP